MFYRAPLNLVVRHFTSLRVVLSLSHAGWESDLLMCIAIDPKFLMQVQISEL